MEDKNINFINAKQRKKYLLRIGIIVNIVLLGYFKYTDFFLSNINVLFNGSYDLRNIVLPLAISFFTFEQIAFLVDAYNGKAKKYDFFSHCLFVTFFPQLIAGPIVHHNEILPQYRNNNIFSFNTSNLSIGITIFVIGLFKKVILADNVSFYSTPIFDAAMMNYNVSFFEAWAATLAYSLQIYFDFSGYSDMAIGLSRMFGILIPVNFYSPYKANNIIEFWRRWHITLSRFLKNYLYIPLGGNRRGENRRKINLMITMLIGGFWHGASWNFIIWGGLHGMYLIVNHAFRLLRLSKFLKYVKPSFTGRMISRIITYISILIAWVYFRAENISGANNIVASMVGMNGFTFPTNFFNKWDPGIAILMSFGAEFTGPRLVSGWSTGIPIIASLYLIVWLLPNTQQFMVDYNPSLNIFKGEVKIISYFKYFKWRPNLLYCLSLIIISIILLFAIAAPSEFLYFQF